MDRVGADFDRVCEQMVERLKTLPVPLQLPWGSGAEFRGLIDLLRMQAIDLSETDRLEGPLIREIPPELVESAARARERLIEAACEVDDELMASYLAGEAIDDRALVAALRRGTTSLRFTPVLCGSAFRCKGVLPLLDAVTDLLPSPLDVPPIVGRSPLDGQRLSRRAADDEPFAALVFKIMTDPYVGQVAFLRVYSGWMQSGDHVYNAGKQLRARVGRLLKIHANKREEIKQVGAGDIAAAVGLRNATTGDTICAENEPVLLESMDFPEPVIRLAIEPKTKADQEKLGTALSKLVQEDPTFRVQVDPETGQTLIAGMGELHLDVLVDRLRREFDVSANVGKPQVAYRETIRAASAAEVRFVKQTGGHGQYAHVKLRVAPGEPDSGLHFESTIVGGKIPKEYIPAIQTGAEEVMESGVLAGYAMRAVRVEVYDGSYHEVDSSELAFKIAGSRAFREACERADPVLLEPVMRVEIVAPEEYTGDVIGNLNARRGRIQHIDSRPGLQVIVAAVPMAEMFGYATELRSITQGRGDYTMHFAKYEEVPKNISSEVVARVTGAVGR